MLDKIMTPELTASIHTLVLTALQTILLAVVSGAGYAIKLWINSMNSSWKQALAERLVKYAEQKIGDNVQKEKWVSDQLSTMLKGRVTPEEVSHLIEEAVVNLKAQTAQPVVYNVTAEVPGAPVPPEPSTEVKP